MRATSLFFFGSMVALAACVSATVGSNSTDDDTSSSNGGAGGTVTASSVGGQMATAGSGGATSSSTGGSGSTVASSVTASSSTASSVTASSVTASSSTGGMSMLTVSVVKHDFYINCQQSIPSDPINGSVTIEYDNSAGTMPGYGTVSAASLQMTKANDMLGWKFTITPGNSGMIPAMTKSDVIHSKVANMGKGSAAMPTPCEMCGGDWIFSMPIKIDGQFHLVQAPSEPIQCVY
ncbi:MAG: hypothetical protein VB934_19750 [Polyangiaceae bacterium]